MKIPEFRIGDFIIDEDFKKRGGQASVIKGLHSTHGEVAIKEWFTASNDMRKEVELLKINTYHQNIIQFLGILINKKSKCIGYVMPYMPMGSLHDVIHDKSKQYDQKQIKSWITQICYGLSYLHGEKIIHRDIKPSNILLGRCYDDVKLSDFGTAKSLEMVSYARTPLGTPLYVAPEVLKRERYDKSADIYSLSITIWEILCRRIPYDHIIIELDFPNKVANGERPQLNNNLSAEVSDLLTKCWHADASKRPTIQDVLEFFNNTEFVYTGLQNPVSECATSFENLNVHNGHGNFSETIIYGNVARLKEIFDPSHAKPKNVQNELAVVRTRALNDDRRPPIPSRDSPRRSDSPNIIEQSHEEQTILLLGGIDKKNNDSMLVLENNGQKWKELNIKLPHQSFGHGAQFLNNNLYIFGGDDIGEELNWTYRLSESLQWEKMANMNKKRDYISNSSVILNNQIWVCGGMNGKDTLNSVEMYDPEANIWKKMKEMNQCRGSIAATVVNGKIFCSGGYNGTDLLDSVECYDPSSDVWTFISNMPQIIKGHGAVEKDGFFIVMGGYREIKVKRKFKKSYVERIYSKNIWALDTTDKNAKWIEKPSMSISRKDFSIAKIDGKTFVYGGETKENMELKILDSMEIFDGEVLRNGPKMQTTRRRAPAVVIPISFAKSLN